MKFLNDFMKRDEYKIQNNRDLVAIMKSGTFIFVSLGLLFSLCAFIKLNNLDPVCKDTNGAFATYLIGLIAGFFALAGFFLLYLTFRNQTNNFEKERFENNLFEMIRANRQIVSEMEYEVPDDDVPRTVKGHKIFVRIEKHFREAYKMCSIYFDQYGNVENGYFLNNEVRSKEFSIYKKYLGDSLTDELFDKLARVNIVYLIVFYGVSENGSGILQQYFKELYNENLCKKIITRLKGKYAEWDLKSRRRYKIKYFGGHQIRLGHYYRNYFSIINYINDKDFIDYQDKHAYVKILRSQTSNYEQFIFFLNSLSHLGRIWEIEAEKNNRHFRDICNNQLITKYDLIKNLPKKFSPIIEPSDIYKLVEYELENDNPLKRGFIEKYK
jgi:hypothetical protein